MNRRDVFEDAFREIAKLGGNPNRSKTFLLLEQYTPDSRKGEISEFLKLVRSILKVGDVVRPRKGQEYIVEKVYTKKKNKQEIRLVDLFNPVKKTHHKGLLADSLVLVKSAS